LKAETETKNSSSQRGAPDEKEFDIAALAHEGDGKTVEGVFVPYALPGERVRTRSDGRRTQIVEILRQSPHRVAPPCTHFGTCGGCALQHLELVAYRNWKREQVVQAFAHRGFPNLDIKGLLFVEPGSRRRIELAATRSHEGVSLGFHERHGKTIVPISECHVARPEIVALIPKLKSLAEEAFDLGQSGDIAVLWTKEGADVSVLPETRRVQDFGPLRRMRLSNLAAELDLARLTIDGEVIVERRRPFMKLGTVDVVPPPGAFVQPVAEAEQAMQHLVVAGLAGCKRLLDLFSGCGTFTFPLATKHPVHAVEADEAALEAVDQAARAARGLKPITQAQRDLYRRPLLPAELKRFDGAVLDPPRSGARAQCEQLAKSPIKRIVYVSCDPATLARDARSLVDGGFTLAAVTPIDQFLWSPHIEVVGYFERR
jgi:23S rRNA (uracil1939-C5)-methyltransferase